MIGFFVKTECSAVGPFTGIELREASLSRIITADSLIGGSPAGPWTIATETGLFSQGKMPLPHPDGVHVPQYHVRGLSFAAEGPFKLRELIGFAARGMLRSEAMLQSDLAPDWISIERIPILKACLTGELVLLGADGRDQAVRMQVGNKPTAMEPAALLSTGSFEDKPLPQEEEAESPKLEIDLNADEADIMLPWWRQSISMPQLNPSFSLSNLRVSRRVALITVGFVLLSAGIATAYSRWQRAGLKPEQIIGSWIADDNSFSITFRDDGNIVVFNTDGNSWSGEYEWIAFGNNDRSVGTGQSVSAQIASVAPGDAIDNVRPSDGYVRFRASALERTFVNGQEVADGFLRFDGEELLFGYLASIDWTDRGKRMEAGWTRLHKQPSIGIEPLSALADLEIEPPPKNGFSLERSPHVSVVAAELMTQYETGDEENLNTDGLCYSVCADANYLLQQYGAPDEARPVLPFDKANLPGGVDFSASQLLRYGALRLILSGEGKLQQLSLSH
ncbi:MAG: hypothetical protein WBD20_27190 [Pirellulaceae bacterium]